MARYVVRRLLLTIPVLIGASLLIYAMVLFFTSACGVRAYMSVHGGGI